MRIAVFGGLLVAGLAWPIQAEVQPEEPPPAATPASGGEEYRQTGHFPEERTDADGDGVPDIDDNCPDTPREQATPAGVLTTKVDECGCPRDPCTCDTDVDGVPDCRDLCANTVVGALVGADGCALPVVEVRREVLPIEFDFERAEIKPEYEPMLVEIRERLLAAPTLAVRFEGHADWKGTQSFNQPLSERRAQACRDFVARDTALAPDRVSAAGFGELRPVADNRTDEGRARNRRVEAVFYEPRNAPPAADPTRE